MIINEPLNLNTGSSHQTAIDEDAPNCNIHPVFAILVYQRLIRMFQEEKTMNNESRDCKTKVKTLQLPINSVNPLLVGALFGDRTVEDCSKFAGGRDLV